MLLDEEKLEALRSWGERLGQAGGEESAAVGRAILMLVGSGPLPIAGCWSLEQERDGFGATIRSGDQYCVRSRSGRLTTYL